MNEKKLFFYCALFLVFTLVGCKTCPSRDVVLDPGTGADTVRTDIATISDGQTELAITSEQIAGTSQNIADGLGELDLAIISGTDADKDFAGILRAIRDRKFADPGSEAKGNKSPEGT